MVIKLIGLGFVEYARDKFNLFDCFIVIMSTFETVVELANLNNCKEMFMFTF
jgi:hypothetical protein